MLRFISVADVIHRVGFTRGLRPFERGEKRCRELKDRHLGIITTPRHVTPTKSIHGFLLVVFHAITSSH